MNKNVFVVGFMLFAIFFGAGNLIFPPKLGAEAATAFWPSISGFVITGVGLPLLGIIVSAFYKGGYKEALKQIHPLFALAYLIAIYLAIGPFFGGPRTGITAYEIAAVPFLDEPNATTQFIFCLVYFSIALWISLNPSKMVDRIGSVLTPVLLISLIALVVKAYFILNGNEPVANPKNLEGSFFTGIIEGYFTLDALAAVAFAVLVVNAIKEKNDPNSSLQKQTVYAGIVAAVALAAIYIALGWIGNHLPINHADMKAGQNLGTYILNSSATLAFGELGRMVLGLIVTLACLTTTVGLASAVSEYFNEIFPRISYKTYVVIFCVICFAIANLGLDAVISKSLPVLLILYPISMTMILLLLVNLFVRLPLISHRIALGLVTIEAIFVVMMDKVFTKDVLGSSYQSVIQVIRELQIREILEQVPLKEFSMEWIPFAVGGVVLGYIIQAATRKKRMVIEQQ